MTTLAQELARLQRVPVSQSGRHLELLRAYADHGHEASRAENLEFLQRLRKTRDELSERAAKITSGPRVMLQQWASDCRSHEGLLLLRANLLASEKLQELKNEEISRVYNQLRRMNLVREAEEVWPSVHERVATSKMGSVKELLGLWSVAPQGHLAELDGPLARALDDGVPRSWQMLSAISRATDWPGSKAVSRCVEELAKRLKDLSSEDLALIVGQAGAVGSRWRSRDGAEEQPPEALRQLAREAKAKLVEREATLEPVQLCGLLASIEERTDPMWPMVRRQLLLRKDLNVGQLLAVCDFVHRTGGSSEEQQLWGHTVKQLQKMLNTRSQPGLVLLVAKSLDILLESHYTCQSLLNAAIKLREDLYPAALWKLFVRAGEVNLVQRHPALQARLQRIGGILEQHGIKKSKMTLREMPDIVRAMRKNKVVLQQCLSQMSKQFLDVLEVTKEEMADGVPIPERLQEPDDSTAQPAAPSESQDAQPAVVDKANWLGDVQSLMVTHWIQLQSLQVDDPSLRSMVASFCVADGDCRIDALAAARSVAELDGLRLEEADAIRDGLVAHLMQQLPKMKQRDLVMVAKLATSVEVWRAVTAEVRKRLSGTGVAYIATLRRGQDLDDLTAILSHSLAWSQKAAPHTAAIASEGSSASKAPPDLMARRIMQLVADSLEDISLQEPALARQRLVAAAGAFSAFEQGVPLDSLRRSLHKQAKSDPPWDLAGAVDVAYNFSALYGGALPFDVAARLWKLVGSVLAEDKGGIGGLPNTHVAKFKAFALSAKHLSSSTVVAALRLAPEAPTMETCLNSLRKNPERFELAKDQRATQAVTGLRSALPETFPGEVLEEQAVVPGTPYVVDFVLECQKALLVVPRALHRAADASDALSGPGRLMQRTLEAFGWRVHWAWQDDAAATVRGLSGVSGAAQLSDQIAPEPAMQVQAAPDTETSIAQ